jgi:hypothetical protein
MMCDPVVSELVVNDAWPFVRFEVPSVVGPSRKATGPVAAVGVVAVKVTG